MPDKEIFSVIEFTLPFQIPGYNETCVLLNAGPNCDKIMGYRAVYRMCFTMVCSIYHSFYLHSVLLPASAAEQLFTMGKS